LSFGAKQAYHCLMKVYEGCRAIAGLIVDMTKTFKYVCNLVL
jgi:hypothetical protein